MHLASSIIGHIASSTLHCPEPIIKLFYKRWSHSFFLPCIKWVHLNWVVVLPKPDVKALCHLLGQLQILPQQLGTSPHVWRGCGVLVVCKDITKKLSWHIRWFVDLKFNEDFMKSLIVSYGITVKTAQNISLFTLCYKLSYTLIFMKDALSFLEYIPENIRNLPAIIMPS